MEDFLIQKDCSGLALKLQQEGLDHILVVRLDKMVTKVTKLDKMVTKVDKMLTKVRLDMMVTKVTIGSDWTRW